MQPSSGKLPFADDYLNVTVLCFVGMLVIVFHMVSQPMMIEFGMDDERVDAGSGPAAVSVVLRIAACSIWHSFCRKANRLKSATSS